MLPDQETIACITGNVAGDTLVKIITSSAAEVQKRMAEQPAWIVTTGENEQPPPPSGDWGEVVRSAASGAWGSVTALRAGTQEKLILRFSEQYASLEHWASDDGPVSGARFSNRRPVVDEPVELPCCGCGIALDVPEECVLRKADGLRLFLMFLRRSRLPEELVEPPQAATQPALPSMKEYVVPKVVLNAVIWQPL